MICAATYARVSSDEQAENGTSLETQTAQSLAKATSLGWYVPADFQILEDWTGKDLSRPGLQRILELARTHSIAGLIVYTLDRLYRPENPGDEWRVFELLQRIKDAGVVVEFVDSAFSNKDNPFSGFMMFLDSWRAGEERRKIIERTVRGKRAKAEQGRIPQGTGIGIFGYFYNPQTKTRTVNPEQAAVVKRIFSWAAEGVSFHGMAQRLNKEGVPSFSGKKWHPLTIRRMITNQTYTGKAFYGKTHRVMKDGKKHLEETPHSQWIEITGSTPPIISTKEFDAAQLGVSGSRAIEVAEPRKNLLSGHIFCGTCGGKLTGSVLQGKYPYYYCRRNWKRYGGTCNQPYIRAEGLETATWEVLSEVLEKPQVILQELERGQSQTLPFLQKEEADIKRRLALIGEQEKRLVHLFSMAEVDEALLTREMHSLREKRKANELRLDEIRSQIARVANLVGTDTKVEKACRQIRSRLSQLTFENKRLALKSLKSQIWVYPDRVEVRGRLPVFLTTARTSA